MPTSRRFRNLKWINFPDEIDLHLQVERLISCSLTPGQQNP